VEGKEPEEPTANSEKENPIVIKDLEQLLMKEEPSEPLDDIVENDDLEEDEMKEELSEALHDIVEGDDPEEDVDETLTKAKNHAKPETSGGVSSGKMEEEDYDNPWTDEEEEESIKEEELQSHVEESPTIPLKKERLKDEQPVVQKEEESWDDDPWQDEVVQLESVKKAEDPLKSEIVHPESVEKAEDDDDPWADDDDDDPWADDENGTKKEEDELKSEVANPEDDFEEPLVKPTTRNRGEFPKWRRREMDRVPDGRRRYVASARSWCAEEEELFWLCLARFGMDFNKIADRLPGKKRKAVRNKWRQFDRRCDVYAKIDEIKKLNQDKVAKRIEVLTKELNSD